MPILKILMYMIGILICLCAIYFIGKSILYRKEKDAWKIYHYAPSDEIVDQINAISHRTGIYATPNASISPQEYFADQKSHKSGNMSFQEDIADQIKSGHFVFYEHVERTGRGMTIDTKSGELCFRPALWRKI